MVVGRSQVKVLGLGIDFGERCVVSSIAVESLMGWLEAVIWGMSVGVRERGVSVSG